LTPRRTIHLPHKCVIGERRQPAIEELEYAIQSLGDSAALEFGGIRDFGAGDGRAADESSERRKAAPSSTETVYYRHGHRGYGYGYHHGGGGALLGGLAAGAIIGGAIAASQANAAAQQNAAYCARRYRSYDPASGTYLNNDGNRYPCP
jgi:hypothetical protein